MSASGSHVTKAVTVVELLKRRVPVSDSVTKGGGVDGPVTKGGGVGGPVHVYPGLPVWD